MADYGNSLLDGDRKTNCDLYCWVKGTRLQEAAVVRMLDLRHNDTEYQPVKAGDGTIKWTSTCDIPLGRSYSTAQGIPKYCVPIPMYNPVADTPNTVPVGNGKRKVVYTVWKLPTGTQFPDHLGAYNDHDSHVTISPPRGDCVDPTR